MSKKGCKKTIEKLVDESIEETKSEKKTEKQDTKKETLDEKLLEVIDEDIKKEEDETRNKLVPIPNKVNQKVSKKDSTEEPTEKFTEGLDTVTNVKEIGGVEDAEDNDIKPTTEVRPNILIIVGKEDLPSCSCEEDSDPTEMVQEPDEMTSKEAVAAMQSQVRRSWKGKVTFAVIMIVCISLAYYKPMYPDQDFFNNLTYYIIFIGMLAPLLLYIIINEFDKYLKKKKGIDITKNHKDSLLVKQDKPKNTQPRPMSPLTASVLGTYYTMLEKANNTSLDAEEKQEENTEKNAESSEDENLSGNVSEEISGILSDMLSESDNDCNDGVCKKSGKMPDETPEASVDTKPDKKPEKNKEEKSDE